MSVRDWDQTHSWWQQQNLIWNPAFLQPAVAVVNTDEWLEGLWSKKKKVYIFWRAIYYFIHVT